MRQKVSSGAKAVGCPVGALWPLNLSSEGPGSDASRPLPSVPTKVRLLNRLPTLDLGSGDYSSMPESGHLAGREKRVAKPALKGSTNRAMDACHAIDTAPPVGEKMLLPRD